jgi:hypothetical protein
MKLKIVLLTVFAALLYTHISEAAGRTWVIFRDRGYTSAEGKRQAIDREIARLLPATRQRLLKVRSAQDLLTETDLPIHSGYLREIERITGLKPHALCRTINGASYPFTPTQIVSVKSLPFVKEIRPVRAFRGEKDPVVETPAEVQGAGSTQDRLHYGPSYTQNVLENFIPAHDAGYSGEGVFVGQLDAGWDNLGHRCFDSLEIVATWDFVNGDSSVANDPGQLGEGSHGTKTLSCYAGYDRGQLVGTAYGVRVALAKTECTSYELPIEEDNWAAGIEWLDSLGVVLATSSVSYGTLHTYPELNGNTTVITIAADNAVSRGIVVVNSVSNHGTWAYPGNKMSPPSDGDSVLAVGAVNTDSTRASFSSIGPTYDGRIKPDLMALGSVVWVANSLNDSSYSFASGTSFSTPLTAGACALLLQVNPHLTPMQVHAILKGSATQVIIPDTLMGWGIYNVWEAIQTQIPHPPKIIPPIFKVISVIPNPFTPLAHIAFDLPYPGVITLSAYDLLGRSVAVITRGFFPVGRSEVVWDALGLSSGLYFIRLESPWGAEVRKAVIIK